MSFTPNEAHYQKIVEGIKHAHDAINQADRAIRAGIDLSAVKKRAEESLDKLSRLRQEYYPGR